MKFIKPWADERFDDYRKFYRPSRTGQQVGVNVFDHFSAMIWSSTTGVGCAYATNCPGRWKTIVVCNYSPPGNIRGRGWFEYGSRCSRCPRGYNGCDNGLCTRSASRPAPPPRETVPAPTPRATSRPTPPPRRRRPSPTPRRRRPSPTPRRVYKPRPTPKPRATSKPTPKPRRVYRRRVYRRRVKHTPKPC